MAGRESSVGGSSVGRKGGKTQSATICKTGLEQFSLPGRPRAKDAVGFGRGDVRPSGGVHFAVPNPTGRVRNPRKGLFYASDLVHSKEAKQYFSEFPDLEKQCILRFPPQYAEILRSRLSQVQDSTGTNSADVAASSRGMELGLKITPTAREDYRIFDIDFIMELGNLESIKSLVGVLVELPCVIESYKCLDGDYLFKSADVSQMMYVYDPVVDTFDVETIRNKHFWEWKAGLTPPSHRIRTRKFRNFEVFEKTDIQMGEMELLDVLRGTLRESVIYETVSDLERVNQEEAARNGLLGETNVSHIVGPDDDLFDEAHITSDLSDRLFGEYSEDEGNEVEEEAWLDGGGGFVFDESGNIVLPDGVGDVYGASRFSSSSSDGSSSSAEERRKKEEKKRKKDKKKKKREKRWLQEMQRNELLQVESGAAQSTVENQI